MVHLNKQINKSTLQFRFLGEKIPWRIWKKPDEFDAHQPGFGQEKDSEIKSTGTKR